MTAERIPRSRRHNFQFGSAGSPRVACPTGVSERLKLYGEACAELSALRRWARKTSKCVVLLGENFLESGSPKNVPKSIPPLLC